MNLVSYVVGYLVQRSLPAPGHLQSLRWASLWRWARPPPGWPPWSDGTSLTRCLWAPMQPRTSNHGKYASNEWKSTDITKNSASLSFQADSSKASHSEPRHILRRKHRLGGRWPLPLHQHSLTAPQQLKPQYLQRAVFPPLQELHEAIHHPGSGYDLVNGWVGFCPEQ